MGNLIGKIFKIVFELLILAIAILMAIPTGLFKYWRNQKSRLLFTGKEQALLAKAQRVITMANNGLLSPDRDLLEVAKCIEEARYNYQIIKGREKFDISFAAFVLPQIEHCHISNMANVVAFFELNDLDSPTYQGLPSKPAIAHNQDYDSGVASHKAEKKLSATSPETISKVKLFLQPQIEQLKAEGITLHINDITYVYIGALAAFFSKSGINLKQIRDLVKNVFPEDEHSFLIDNAYNVAAGSSDFSEKLGDILPLVSKEIAAGKGEFFVKYTRKAQTEISKMFSADFNAEDFDPSKISRTSFLDV